jgi:hypothetical protein
MEIALYEIDSIFKNVSFITFNYDRCIEHFLFHSIRDYYGIDENRMRELMGGLRVFHPYGAVGLLPWQTGPGEGVPFGGIEYSPKLLPISRQIKTFTERVEDDAALTVIRNEVAEAEVVVFLGFAFLEENMKLISPGHPTKAKRVFATAHGILIVIAK